MNSAQATVDARPEAICLACGLCCNGVIFSDVKLLPREKVTRALLSGMSSSPAPKCFASKPRTFPQPCPAFDGCRCEIYSDRPQHCRRFECLLLKKLKAGEVFQPQALRTIGKARRLVETVKRSLRLLGDKDEDTALAARFRRLSQALPARLSDKSEAARYGRLTLAFHKLNVLLGKEFYPAPRDQ